MRKRLCLGIVTIAASCVGGYWLCSKPAAIGPAAVRPQLVRGGETDDGGAETSDTIEPLVVDQGRGVVFRPIPLARDEMLPRVVFAPGMSQPPRPESNAPRMPYADEEAILALPLDPIARILAAPRAPVNVFEGVNFDEEAEPEAQPPPDYHRMQPHCPYPYYRR